MPNFKIGRLKGECVVTWRDGSGRRRYRLGTRDPKEAERIALDVIRRETVKPEGQTVADLWDAYREEKEGRKIAETMRHERKAVMDHFGALRPDQITIKHSRDYTAIRRKAGKKDGTIWTELGHLRIVMNWAQKRRLIDHAPVIERPAKPAPKDRWLTRPEIDKLLAAPMSEHTRLAILLMLSTGARVSAALELTWDRVHFERGEIDLRVDSEGPRKGRARVPMNAGLKAALTHAKAAALTDHVIEWAGEPVKSIKRGVRAAVVAAGLEDVTPHVFRHTAAVHLVANGVPLHRVSQYLGHSSVAVTESIYARFAPDHLREEAEILDFTTIRATGT